MATKGTQRLPCNVQNQLESVTPVGNGLAGWWGLDTGVGFKTTDGSRNGNTGTLLGYAQWAGTSIYFDGINDAVDVGNAASISTSLGSAFSLTAWVSPDAFTASGQAEVVLSNYTASDESGYSLSIERVGSTATFIAKAVFSTANNSHVAISSPAYATGDWRYWVTFVYDGINGTVCLDQGCTSAAATGNLKNNGANGTNTYIGYGGIGGCTACGGYYIGGIDDVRLYNRALTSTEWGTLHITLLEVYQYDTDGFRFLKSNPNGDRRVYPNKYYEQNPDWYIETYYYLGDTLVAQHKAGVLQ